MEARQEYSAAELVAAVRRVTKATAEAGKSGEELKLSSPPVILQTPGRCRFTEMFRGSPRSPGAHSHVVA